MREPDTTGLRMTVNECARLTVETLVDSHETLLEVLREAPAAHRHQARL
jgi:hypothetical protein